MQKIADASELEAEIRRLLAYTQGESPSRSRLASELQTLSTRLASDESEVREVMKLLLQTVQQLAKVRPTLRMAAAALKRADSNGLFRRVYLPEMIRGDVQDIAENAIKMDRELDTLVNDFRLIANNLGDAPIEDV
jgi:hypothetical protein